MGTWHAFQNLTLPTGLFLKEITLGEIQRGAHRTCGLDKLMNPAWIYWKWGGLLHVHLPRETLGNGSAGLVKQDMAYALMID